MSVTIEGILARAPVMPVLVIERLEDAVPLARALVAGGLPVLEVTLRTPVALQAISAIGNEVEGAIVGAGTVVRAQEFAQVERAGGQFAISPGATPGLLQAGAESALAYLPAVSTVSELMRALEAGYDHFKFFPAEACGGTAALRAIAGPFPQVRFCPTGGIAPANFLDYLRLPNVCCVGGSWLAPRERLSRGEWPAITALAQEAVSRAQTLT